MKLLLSGIVAIFISGLVFWDFKNDREKTTGAPPYLVTEDPPNDSGWGQYAYLKDWKRPEGPIKVGLQAGHWKNDEIPDELSRLKGNTGSASNGITEWEVNLKIAQETAKILQTKGIIAEILPTTIPVDYWADVFVAVHADGNTDRSVSGFKAAVPRRDMTGNNKKLLEAMETAYEKNTRLEKDPNVSRNMRGYYAFGWWRFDHAIHPMTPAIILETGFLTNYSDRLTIVNRPEKAAAGIAEGIVEFLKATNFKL